MSLPGLRWAIYATLPFTACGCFQGDAEHLQVLLDKLGAAATSGTRKGKEKQIYWLYAEEMPLCLEVMGLWEGNKREKVITDNATSKSVGGINLIKGLPTWWLFLFSHKREVLRSTLALSRQIDWITHKKIIPFVRVLVIKLEVSRGWVISNSVCHSRTVVLPLRFFLF